MSVYLTPHGFLWEVKEYSDLEEKIISTHIQ